jgi:hypothetical protein
MASWADSIDEPIEIEQTDINPMTFWDKIIEVSKDRPNDEYNYMGVNISSQVRRQQLIPWKVVDRSTPLYKFEDMA